MSKPLVITISHQLSKQEAKRRLQDNTDWIHSQLAPFTKAVDSHWTEDRMDFRVTAVGQTVAGQIDVLDDAVRVEVQLPWMLSWLHNVIGDRVRQQGRLMLARK
jgi:predicted metal-dependent hydrolase